MCKVLVCGQSKSENGEVCVREEVFVRRQPGGEGVTSVRVCEV